MIKEAVKNNRGFLLLCLAVMIVFLSFCNEKKGFFIDELYTYGLANGYYETDIADYDIYDRLITDNPFHRYLTVQEGQRFAYGAVYDNQIDDVHPPLYYILLHTVSSLLPDTFSKWQGLLLNVPLFLLALFLLVKISKLFFENPVLRILPAALWGLSAAGISTAVFIRMYMLLTLLTLWNLWIHLKAMRDGQTIKMILSAGICILLGYLIQYYFLIGAFFTSGFYVLLKLKKKQWKEAAVYCAAAFAGLGGGYGIFPYCLAQFSSSGNSYGASLKEHMSGAGYLLSNVISFLSNVNYGFFGKLIVPVGDVLILILAICLVLAGTGAAKSAEKDRRNPWSAWSEEDFRMLYLILVFGCSVATTMLVSWIPASRYYYNLFPLVGLMLVYLFWRIPGTVIRGRAWKRYAVFMIALWGGVTVYSYTAGTVEYLYPEEQEILRTMEETPIETCIYLTDYKNAPVTQDLEELARCSRVYITAKEGWNQALEATGAEGAFLLIVDDGAGDWGSGYDAKEILDGAAAAGWIPEDREKPLFTRELSEAYVMRRMDE